jgi:23S rRNA pseudouridine955/2504/2580 synthase
MIKNSVIYEDANLLALNKPAGLVVHGGTGRTYGVIELLRLLYPAEADKLQLAHRLDRETSGVLLVTRDLRYLAALQDCFREGRIHKDYQALLKGKPARKVIRVDKPLGRNIMRSGERISSINDTGKQARTTFKEVRVIKDTWLADIEIETGRTHQIRVHAASLGHPVAGDEKYGDKSFNKRLRRAGLNRLFLHACRVRIPALGSGKALSLSAPLPADLTDFIDGYARTGARHGQV